MSTVISTPGWPNDDVAKCLRCSCKPWFHGETWRKKHTWEVGQRPLGWFVDIKMNILVFSQSIFQLSVDSHYKFWHNYIFVLNQLNAMVAAVTLLNLGFCYSKLARSSGNLGNFMSNCWRTYTRRPCFGQKCYTKIVPFLVPVFKLCEDSFHSFNLESKYLSEFHP